MIKSEFFEVTERLADGVGRPALRIAGGQVNAAHTDAVLVGATLALREGASLSPQACKAAIKALTSDEDYLEAVSGSTSHSDNVRNRLKLAVEAFSESS